MPAFFLMNYPEYRAQFILLKTLFTMSGGLFSNLLAGIISDKYSKSNPYIYSQISKWGSFLVMPFLFTASWCSNNFWISISCILAKYVIGEGYWGPTITMI
jgi:sugar phosphate permease